MHGSSNNTQYGRGLGECYYNIYEKNVQNFEFSFQPLLLLLTQSHCHEGQFRLMVPRHTQV